MGRLTSRLVQSAYKVSDGRNEYNDVVYTPATTAIPCMYRDITNLDHQSNYETIRPTGQLWFDDDAVVAEGEVYEVDGQWLKIQQIVIARSRLRANAIEFYKCLTTKQRQIS